MTRLLAILILLLPALAGAQVNSITKFRDSTGSVTIPYRLVVESDTVAGFFTVTNTVGGVATGIGISHAEDSPATSVINFLFGGGDFRYGIDVNTNLFRIVGTSSTTPFTIAETGNEVVLGGNNFARNLTLTNGVGGSTRWVGGTLFTQTNIVGLTNVGFKCLFDGIGTTNLPANFFEVGRSLVVDMEGKWLCANGDNWTNQVRLGGTMIASNLINSVQLPSVESDWRIRVRLTPIAIGASGRIRVSGGVTTVRDGGDAMATSGIPWTPSTVVTVDTTAALSFGVMSACSATAVDANYIHVTGGNIKVE